LLNSIYIIIIFNKKLMNNLFRININIINYIKKPKISLSNKMKYFIPYGKDFLNIYTYKIRINFPNI
jgi:hypothetical protein